MSQNTIQEIFTEGKILFPGKAVDAAKLSWYEHPAFKGVFLKDLVTAADTKGAFSCHVVKVKKGCQVGEHYHNAEWEFNEALEGTWLLTLGGKQYECGPGFTCVTPPGVPHVVSAPDEDVYLLAKFVPALV